MTIGSALSKTLNEASLKIAEYFWPYQPRWLQMLCDWWTPIIWVKSVWNVRMQNLFLLTKKTGNVAFVETTTSTSRAVCRPNLFTRLVNLFPGMETDWPIMVVRHAFLACLLACLLCIFGPFTSHTFLSPFSLQFIFKVLAVLFKRYFGRRIRDAVGEKIFELNFIFFALLRWLKWSSDELSHSESHSFKARF